MRAFTFCLFLMVSGAAFADVSALEESMVAVPSTLVVAGALDAGTPALDMPVEAAREFYVAAKSGNGWLAAMFMLFFVVGIIRTVGKHLHAMIPDDTKHWFLAPLEKVLLFIFGTKIGGWVLNWLSAIGGCLSTAAAAGMPVDAAAWKVAVLASTGGTALIELKDDVMEWWAARQEKAKAEEEAKAAVLAVPAPPQVPPTAAS